MEAAESLSTTDWKLLTDVLLLGLAESGQRDFNSQKLNQSHLEAAYAKNTDPRQQSVTAGVKKVLLKN